MGGATKRIANLAVSIIFVIVLVFSTTVAQAQEYVSPRSTDTLTVYLSDDYLTHVDSCYSSSVDTTYNSSKDGSNYVVTIPLTSDVNYFNVNIGQSASLNDASASNNASSISYKTEYLGWTGDYVFTVAGAKGGDLYGVSTGSGSTGTQYGGNGSVATFSVLSYDYHQPFSYTVGKIGASAGGSNYVSRPSGDVNSNYVALSYLVDGYNSGIYATTHHTAYSGSGGIYSAYQGGMSAIKLSDDTLLIGAAGSGGAYAEYYTSQNSAFGITSTGKGLTGRPADTDCWLDYSQTYRLDFSSLYGITDTGMASSNYTWWQQGLVPYEYRNSFYYVTMPNTIGNSTIVGISQTGVNNANVPYTNYSIGSVASGKSGIGVLDSSGYVKPTTRENVTMTDLSAGSNSSDGYISVRCVNKKITLTNPSRVSYWFTGWTTSSNVSQHDNGDGTTTFTVAGGNEWIKANWQLREYRVDYNKGITSN